MVGSSKSFMAGTAEAPELALIDTDIYIYDKNIPP